MTPASSPLMTLALFTSLMNRLPIETRPGDCHVTVASERFLAAGQGIAHHSPQPLRKGVGAGLRSMTLELDMRRVVQVARSEHFARVSTVFLFRPCLENGGKKLCSRPIFVV